MTTLTSAPAPRRVRTARTSNATVGTLMDLVVLVRQLEVELNDVFFEREEAIDVVLTTMLAGAHGFMHGEPGTGKSDLLETICKAIVAGKYARFLMDPFMGKEDFFGAHDITRYLAGGGWHRDTTDTSVDATMMLIDEAGRTPGGILASMLTLMNEGIYKENGVWIKVPLISAWGASNSWLFDVLPAMADRFLVNMSLEYMKEEANVARLIDRASDGVRVPITTQIPLPLLQHAVDVDVPAVQIPPGVRAAIVQLKSDLRAEQIILSDRRWFQVIGLVKAAAFKAGRTVADEADLHILQHALFNHPDQRSIVRAKVLALTGPITKEAQRISAILDSISAEIDKRRRESIADRAAYGAQAQFDLGEVQTELGAFKARMESDGRDVTPLVEIEAQIDALNDKIFTDCMNVPAGRRARTP